MADLFVSETITPLKGSFDPMEMAQGQPSIPRQFRWRRQMFQIADVLEQWKEYADCTHGSEERYLRRHGFLVKTSTGLILKIYFQRTPGKTAKSSRWWIQTMKPPAD
jgi:phosphoribosylglycinamide formyltransferase-1